MPIERVSSPDPSPKELTDADRTRIVVKFAMLEAPGALVLVGFLLAYFVFDAVPQRPEILAGALFLFALYVAFAMWASGLLGMMTGRTHAGR